MKAMTDPVTEHMLWAASKLELHAIWEEPDSPSGWAAHLVTMPEDENEPGVFAVVRVRDAETAFRLEELLADAPCA